MSKPFYERGRYNCEIVTHGLSKSSKGTPQAYIRFKVLEFEDGERVAAQYERTCWRALTEKAIDFAIKDLRALGFRGDSFRAFDLNNANSQSLEGNRVVMWCDHEDDQNGEPRERWGVARDSSDFEVKALEADEQRKLDAIFGKSLKQSPAAESAPQPKPQPVGVGSSLEMGISDDDVPF